MFEKTDRTYSIWNIPMTSWQNLALDSPIGDEIKSEVRRMLSEQKPAILLKERLDQFSTPVTDETMRQLVK